MACCLETLGGGGESGLREVKHWEQVTQGTGENSPDVYLLSKQIGVVQVGDGAVHRVAVSHFHHGGSRFTFHELHLWENIRPLDQTPLRDQHRRRLPDADPLHVAIETEDVEDAVCVHLLGVQAVQHDHRRLCVAAVLPRRRGRGPVAGPVAPSTAASHRRTHAATFIPVALVITMVTTSLRHKRWATSR